MPTTSLYRCLGYVCGRHTQKEAAEQGSDPWDWDDLLARKPANEFWAKATDLGNVWAHYVIDASDNVRRWHPFSRELETVPAPEGVSPAGWLDKAKKNAFAFWNNKGLAIQARQSATKQIASMNKPFLGVRTGTDIPLVITHDPQRPGAWTAKDPAGRISSLKPEEARQAWLNQEDTITNGNLKHLWNTKRKYWQTTGQWVNAFQGGDNLKAAKAKFSTLSPQEQRRVWKIGRVLKKNRSLGTTPEALQFATSVDTALQNRFAGKPTVPIVPSKAVQTGTPGTPPPAIQQAVDRANPWYATMDRNPAAPVDPTQDIETVVAPAQVPVPVVQPPPAPPVTPTEAIQVGPGNVAVPLNERQKRIQALREIRERKGSALAELAAREKARFAPPAAKKYPVSGLENRPWYKDQKYPRPLPPIGDDDVLKTPASA